MRSFLYRNEKFLLTLLYTAEKQLTQFNCHTFLILTKVIAVITAIKNFSTLHIYLLTFCIQLWQVISAFALFWEKERKKKQTNKKM